MGAIVLFLSVVVFLFSFSFSWAAGSLVRSSPFLYIPARRKRHRIIMNNLTYPPPTHSPLHSSLLLQINDRVLALLQQQQYTKPTQKKKKREKTKKNKKVPSGPPLRPGFSFPPTLLHHDGTQPLCICLIIKSIVQFSRTTITKNISKKMYSVIYIRNK